jgi:hypothetical protein
MERTWRNVSQRGIVGLIHLETHFTNEKAGVLRAATYERLRRHWQFTNEKKLFEIQNQKPYGVNIYGSKRDRVNFLQAVSLYHPDTVSRSIQHDGSGPEPGIKDPDGNWDLRPHRGRILLVTDETLKTWHSVLEDESTPTRKTRMVYAVNREIAAVLDKAARNERIGDFVPWYSRGWDESIDRAKGFLEVAWGPTESWDDVILQGSHLHVGLPLYKYPNKTLKSQRDWTEVDLEALPSNAKPVTVYKPAGDRVRYDSTYTHWGESREIAARDYYRVCWRRMADNFGQRTLMPALVPPRAALIQTVTSLGTPESGPRVLSQIAGMLASLVSDFMIRVAPKNDILFSSILRLPGVLDHPLTPELLLRTLRLNCVTSVYANLWSACFEQSFVNDSWTGGLAYAVRAPLGDVDQVWATSTPLRISVDRRQALVEIDALVAIMLGLTADELCTLYRTQFPVLFAQDRGIARKDNRFYDTNGRLVPQEVLKVWRTKGGDISEEERTATHAAGRTYAYEPPFMTLDREKDMRIAYEHFERILAERS